MTAYKPGPFEAVQSADRERGAPGRGRASPGLYQRFGKRLLDLALVLLAVPVVLPVTVIAAFAVMLDGGRPFFGQERVGRDGRVFRMWKLRSMIPDAEAALLRCIEANPDLREEWAQCQKLHSDPRVTAVGRVLRKYSIDELPQLWNVLKGDMSLVGRRPMLPEQLPLYAGTAYFLLRPGLTGSWQVSARCGHAFDMRARHDAVYLRKVSLATDLRLILATTGVVLRGTGR